jgi:hypothetical protein
MKRNKFSLSHYKLLTCDLGQLVPCSLTEVLPGDSFLGHTSALVRCTPLLAPLMHPVTVRIHHWFVPTRLVWSGWEDFITGGNDGIGGSSGTYPTITAGGGGFTAKGVLDYLGVPPSVANLEVCELPLRAYNMIYNEFYRDQDMISTEVAENSDVIQKIAWEKDYFTAARPWPQRGPQVTLPLGDEAPVLGIGTTDADNYSAGGSNRRETDQGAPTTFANEQPFYDGVSNKIYIEEDPNSNGYPYIRADLTNATAASVNDIREAFALQRYQEARARYGARYTEYLRYLNVVSPDARLQRPEYLGGGKHNISFSEVLQTSNDGTNGEVGALFGHGISAMRTRKFMKYFPEHGYVMSLISVRPKSMYTDGCYRHWNRRTKEDYWQMELQHIGQQDIENIEVYAQGTSADNDTFGYQDKYDEYRRSPSNIAGEFRDSTYNFWHMGRQFSSLPTLNSDFTDCDPGKRFFAEQTQNSLLVMANNVIRSRRLVARTASNRIY